MPTPSDQISDIHFILFPHDLEKVKRFYADVLQWKVKADWGGLAMFEMGSITLELLSLDHTNGKGYLPVQGCNLSLRIPDVWALWTELQGKATVVFALRRNSWGNDSFCIADPEGFELTFFTDSHLAPADAFKA